MLLMKSNCLTIDLLSRAESKGLRSYGYRTTFANGGFRVAMSLTSDGKIAAISPEAE